MFEQDYIMRLIKELIRTILKLLFHINTDALTIELLEDEEEKETMEALLDMVDEGNINQAENKIFELVEDKANLEMILLFFSYLNDKPDEFLAENDFSRKELQDDLKYVLSEYGLDSMMDAFLNG